MILINCYLLKLHQKKLMDRIICEKIEECKEESNNLKKTLKDKKKGSCNSKYLI